MNKIIYIFVLITIFFLFSCSKLTNKPTVSNGENIQYIDFYVIEASTHFKSYLKAYDKDGNVVDVIEVDCPDINSAFGTPYEYNGNIYAESVGGFLKPSKSVFEFNTSQKKINLYDVAPGMFAVAAKENYLYTSDTPIKGSVIKKYNMNTRKIENTLKVSGYVSYLKLIDDKIYAFGDLLSNEKKLLIHVINQSNLTIEKTIEDKSGYGVFDSFVLDKDIYYSKNNTLLSTSISKFNVTNNTVENISLEKPFPYQIKRYKNNFLISHFNVTERSGNELTQYDYTTSKNTIKKFEHTLGQIEISGDILYACDGNNMYLYNLPDFKLLKKIDVSVSKERDPKENYRNQGFFLIR